ncbi:PREDICTED: FK506-binding protein 5 isoform X1 [Papilio xuthus]|uniref:FK506-binding protein 5 isoform X1 n=1 Tax=Papilio xuthus TaxID=66420 RepID=A0AAJ6Z0W0_PAPXU|nr:PREDICTED: FK506-binding protein 5 isoform X1 [Papilio xuthus]
MANDEVLGPRKTMFVLVIVVGCFAVLWPRILSPLILGHTQEQLKPNQFDREAGCCEVMFETEVAVLELVNEVCGSAVGVGGKLSPYAAAECRKAVNETCGLDIAAFLKRSDNVGKTTKMLLETMKSSNSSCLKEHFGVQLYLNTHTALNSWSQQDTLKQERSPIRGMGPHPALRERGRAIPPGVPPVQPRPPTPLPPHVRVRTSPLSVYYDIEIKPPPIPGMRPPLGSPGGPVPAPKSSMGFVMPIYTICIIVFFVYTLSKILFKRTGTPYESVTPDPQFRRRVFRDDSRSSPDKLGPKERDARDVELEALRARLAETERAMQRIVRQLALHDAEPQDNTRPYTNGTILLNSGPVQIIASEFQESKEKNINEQKNEPKEKETTPEVPTQSKDTGNVEKDIETRIENSTDDLTFEPLAANEKQTQDKENEIESKVIEPQISEKNVETIKDAGVEKITKLEQDQITPEQTDKETNRETSTNKTEESTVKPDTEVNEEELRNKDVDLIALSEGKEITKEVPLAESIAKFIEEEKDENNEEKRSPTELLEDALMEELLKEEEDGEQESPSVKVVGMEVTTHAADGGACPGAQPPLPAQTTQPQKPQHEAADVKSIYLETEIPQQTRVLVADFADRTDRPKPAKHAPLVVSGKMTLSLIQDAPRDTPERDPESTMDDFTTASAMTQPAEKEDDLSEEEIEEEIEEIEIEEEIIEEEVEEEEIEEDEEEIIEPKNAPKTNK